MKIWPPDTAGEASVLSSSVFSANCSKRFEAATTVQVPDVFRKVDASLGRQRRGLKSPPSRCFQCSSPGLRVERSGPRRRRSP